MLCRKHAKTVILNGAQRSEESLWTEKLEVLRPAPIRRDPKLNRCGTQNDSYRVFYKATFKKWKGK